MTREDYINTLELDNAELKKENHELKEDIKYLFNALTKNDTQMTSKEMDVYDKYYLIFNKKGSKVNGKNN